MGTVEMLRLRMNGRVPEYCPFCFENGDGKYVEFRLKDIEVRVHDKETGFLSDVKSLELQVFCRQCGEEIREEDVPKTVPCSLMTDNCDHVGDPCEHCARELED